MTIAYVTIEINPHDIVTNLAAPLENQILTGALLNMRESDSPFREFAGKKIILLEPTAGVLADKALKTAQENSSSPDTTFIIPVASPGECVFKSYCQDITLDKQEWEAFQQIGPGSFWPTVLKTLPQEFADRVGWYSLNDSTGADEWDFTYDTHVSHNDAPEEVIYYLTLDGVPNYRTGYKSFESAAREVDNYLKQSEDSFAVSVIGEVRRGESRHLMEVTRTVVSAKTQVNAKYLAEVKENPTIDYYSLLIPFVDPWR